MTHSCATQLCLLVCQGGEPGRAIDGQTDSWQPRPGGPQGFFLSGSCVMTNVDPGKTAWWQVDLGASAWIESVRIVHQTFRYEFRNDMPLYISDVDIADHLGDAKEDILAVGTLIAVISGVDGA